MAIDLLVGSAMALLYPAAKHAAGKLADGILKNVADDAYEAAGGFLKWLKGKWSGSSKGRRALEDVEADPDDAILQQTLKARLKEAAETDPSFRTELEEKVNTSGAAVKVFISVKEMEDVTGLKVGSFESGRAEVRISGDKGKNITGATIDKFGAK